MSVRDINDSNLARSDIGRWLQMQHPFGLPRAATQQPMYTSLAPVCVCVLKFLFLFFLFFFSFLLYRIAASICNVFTRECAGELHIYREISTDVDRDPALGRSIPDRLKGFVALEKEEISKSIVFPSYLRSVSNVWPRKGSRLFRNCWFVFGRECAHLIMYRCLQIGWKGETRTGLARDWEINACRAGRREKSCNQSPENHLYSDGRLIFNNNVFLHKSK